MTRLALALLLFAAPASAQGLFAPGAAVYPSPPLGRHFLDQPVAQCVIATPVSPTAVMLTPCPAGTGPQAGQLPAAPPPAAEPKAAEPKEIVIRVEVVPVAPTPPAPKAKATPKKCPCP